MPPLYRMLEVCVYSLTNFLPFLAMALYPFRRRLRFSPAVAAALVAVLTLLQMGLGLCAAFFTPGRGSLLSAVSTGLYAVFYFLAVRAYPGKTLFTLLMISNLANLVVIAAKCLEGQLFPALAVQSYRWSFALMMLAVEAVLFLPLLLYVRKVYTPAVEQETSGLAWRYLWLIPATFYLIWYYVIYGNTNLTGLEIALRPSSTIVLLFINTGAALVYYVVARLVLEQEKLVALQQKNYALAMQSLQYENLQERIAEARQAKHDVRHHIALLQDCLRRKDYDAMQAYLDRYQETLPDARQLQFCGNAAVNAVLSYFAQQAAAQQVEFSVKAQLPEYTGVADPDLAVLFGNLLENALTACMQEASPRIVVRITADAHTLCAAVDNTFTGAVRRTTGGFLSTKHAGLGLGTASVRSIAEKYHGVCRLEPRDGVFLYVRLFRHYRRIQPVDDIALLHFPHEEENVLPHLDMLPEGQIRHEQTAAGAAMPLDGEALRCGMLPQLVGGLLQPRKVQRPLQLRQLRGPIDVHQIVLILEPVDTHTDLLRCSSSSIPQLFPLVSKNSRHGPWASVPLRSAMGKIHKKW